jgi:cellulose synthase/poly-beta-1,6-N-acetylglucosamine synthase-like glycosyltransferase
MIFSFAIFATLQVRYRREIIEIARMQYGMLLCFLGYSCLLVAMIVGWRKTRPTPLPSEHNPVKLSVIIPLRNEAGRLPLLMGDLKLQRYTDFQIVLIDDHSNDNTLTIANDLSRHDARIKILTNPGEGKKKALQWGVENTSGDVIVTTDADVRVPADWLLTIAQCFETSSVDMLVGPVKIEPKSFFDVLQSIEFAGLIGSTGAAIKLGYPVMANGANLAYRKEKFLEVGGYNDNFSIASGDDEFLLRKMIAQGAQIRFLANQDGIVSTAAQTTVTDFLSQRLRWAGKWKHNSSFYTVLLAIFIFLFQLMLIVGAVLELTQPQKWLLPIAIVLMGRAIAEAYFLKTVCRFLQVRWSWVAFLVLQVLYPFYVVGIGLFSNFLPNSWKGRRI